jgi:hypothetical protein
LLKLDTDLFGKLLLCHANEPPTVANALSHMHVYGMSHASLLKL